ncbi:MAG: hypothetical protein IJD67_06060 [Clostridia bacterium]|nr:hypothetical protein [Clostridia bacterium]
MSKWGYNYEKGTKICTYFAISFAVLYLSGFGHSLDNIKEGGLLISVFLRVTIVLFAIIAFVSEINIKNKNKIEELSRQVTKLEKELENSKKDEG